MELYRASKSNFLTQPFGVNYFDFYKKLGLLGHNGVDWKAINGEEIRFNVDTRGTVVKTVNSNTQGIGCEVMTVDTNVPLDGTEYGIKYLHVYWHLKDISVKVGDFVDTGDLIGHADNTGQYTTGTHLHYGLYPLKSYSSASSFAVENQNNGYGGAIDSKPYTKNIYVLDYLSGLNQEISILGKIIALVKQLLSK